MRVGGINGDDYFGLRALEEVIEFALQREEIFAQPQSRGRAR
jgi:hypothetical protein